MPPDTIPNRRRKADSFSAVEPAACNQRPCATPRIAAVTIISGRENTTHTNTRKATTKAARGAPTIAQITDERAMFTKRSDECTARCFMMVVAMILAISFRLETVRFRAQERCTGETILVRIPMPCFQARTAAPCASMENCRQLNPPNASARMLAWLPFRFPSRFLQPSLCQAAQLTINPQWVRPRAAS